MMKCSAKIFISLLIVTVAIFSATTSLAQSQTRVQGVVTSLDTKLPISRVNIVVGEMIIGTTDEDGKFSITVERDAKLEFNKEGYETNKFPLRGELEITVMMEAKVVRIQNITVTAKALTNKVTAEPTDIEIKGNYFHLRTKFSIPYQLLTTDCRFVVQSTISDLTTDKIYQMRPVVINGHNYEVVEHRYHHFGETKDPLERYIVENIINKENNIYPFKDSLYIKSIDLENDFQADCYLAIVSYHQPEVFLDTVTIARGTVNPLRFFDMSSVSGLPIDESKYVPTPELELHNTKGVADIEFEIGKTTINYKNPKNKANIEQIRDIIQSVQQNVDATLRSITLRGYASPDGSYQVNKNLADKRTSQLMQLVTENIHPSDLKYITVSSSGIVEKWSTVADLVRQQDSTLVAKLDKIVKTTGDNHTTTQYQVRRLPEYKKVLSPKYLPMLRRVEYEVDYSVFRPLTFEEIRDLYNKGEKPLSRFEYYKLIMGEQQDSIRIEYERASIKHFPNFTIAVNREALRLIESDSVNLDLLQPLLSDSEVPDEIRYNQAVLLTKAREVEKADSVLQKIEITEQMRFLRNSVSLMQGDYLQCYPYFKELGGLNEVLVLLCLKRNKEAFELMKEYMRDISNTQKANYNYIMALCANRNEDLNTSMIYLQMALDINPALTKTASVDSDILDIYELIRLDK